MFTGTHSSLTSDDFRSLLESSIDGFTVVNAQGNIIDVNVSYCQMVGHTREELLKMHISDVDTIDSSEDVARRSEIIVQSGSLRFVTKHRHKSGSIIDVEVTANYSPLLGGAIFSFVRDITQQKQTEEIYRNIVETQTEFVDRYLPGGILTYINPALERFTGVCSEELLGKSFYPFLHEDDREEAVSRIESININNPIVETESRIVLSDGRVRWNRWTHTGFFDEHGTLTEYQSVGSDITERKQVAESLRLSESRFKGAFQYSAIGMAMVSPEGNWLKVNDALCKMLGYSEEELLTKTFQDITHPDDMEADINFVRQMLTGQINTYTMEKRYFHKQGHIVWILLAVSLVRDASNTPLYFISQVEDITKRKNAEKALLESEQRNHLLAETMLHGLVYQDANGTIISMNPAAERILGKSCGEFLGSSSVKEEHDTIRENGEIFPGLEHPAMVALKTGQPVSAVVMGVYNPKLGEYRWISVSAVPVFRSDKTNPSEVYAMFEDITERRRAEEKVAESEYQFRSLFEEMTEGVALHSLVRDDSGTVIDYRIERVNYAYTEILGISQELVTGKLGTEAYGTDTAPYLKKYLDVVQSRKSLRFSTYFPQMDKHFDISVIPWESEGFATIFLDVTARIKAEESRRLETEQLQQTQKLESLGVLAGGIAHDFNNILTSIIGNADLALMRINPASPAIDNLHKIAQSATRAADLAKQMLAYSGKGNFLIETLDINNVLTEMLHILEVSISKNVDLQLNLPPHLPAIDVDATQIRQVVMNLVINASEAIEDNCGVIAITTGCVDCDKNFLKDIGPDKNIKAGRYVFFEITDTGCGMDKETLVKLFDPFFTTKFTGRGLGMAAVQGIVRGHSGFIRVTSEPGKGTCFKVFLPASDKQVETAHANDCKVAWKGKGKVLLVDDEETVRCIGKDMLQEFGFTTITANDGREAVEVFKTTPDISFVILDLTMPHMGGEQCFQELRQLQPDVKVILSSGFNEYEVSQKFIGKGLAGFIQKPYKLSALKEAIQKI